MELDSKQLQEQYAAESAQKTLKLGIIYSAGVLLIIPFFMIAEFLVYHLISLLFCRLLLLAPAAAFLICSLSLFKRQSWLIIPCHLITLGGGSLMMVGITIIRFQVAVFNYGFRLETVTGGLVAAIFIGFLFGAGARKYLGYVIIPSLGLVLLFVILNHLQDWKELSFFINPVIAGLGTAFFSIYHEKREFEEFKLRQLAEYRQVQLEAEIEERKVLEQRLEKLANRDHLTDFYNRRVAFELLDREWQFCRANKHNLSVCFIDLDNLKAVNDTYGHIQGDLLLSTFANVLKECIDRDNHLCRLGGDEFLIIFPRSSAADVERIVDKTKRVLEKIPLSEIPIDFSYGIAEYKEGDQIGTRDLIEIADNNMYKDKLQKSRGSLERKTVGLHERNNGGRRCQ